MKFFQVLGNIFLVIIKVIGKLLGGLFLIGGIIGIGGFLSGKD